MEYRNSKLNSLIKTLTALPTETEWVEFKENNFDPDEIGKIICALANSAALCEKPCGYLVWGVKDSTHEIVGTNYNFCLLKKGNQELQNWLQSLLSNNICFIVEEFDVDGKHLCVVTVEAVLNCTATFKNVEYIRVGSYIKLLNQYPNLKEKLWRKLIDSKFEEKFAMENLDLKSAFNMIDVNTYFSLQNLEIPSQEDQIAHYLVEERILVTQDNGLYAITNLGAILLARRLKDFPRLERKAIRIIQYATSSKTEILKEYVSTKGYAIDLQEFYNYIYALIPGNEPIEGIQRKQKIAYPYIVVREMLVNALIHQDFSLFGTGPIVEIFPMRMEITNPGVSLVEIKRLVDNPAKSRNEGIAKLMRKFKLCEELGTGWDKAVLACEDAKLPAPTMTIYEENTKVTLFVETRFADISFENRVWACYLHASIRFLSGTKMTNSSLRERFGLETSGAGMISRLIKNAIQVGYIKPFDLKASNKFMSYVPFWA